MDEKSVLSIAIAIRKYSSLHQNFLILIRKWVQFVFVTAKHTWGSGWGLMINMGGSKGGTGGPPPHPGKSRVIGFSRNKQ